MQRAQVAAVSSLNLVPIREVRVIGRTIRDPETRYFEDFRRGDVVETRGRTIDASDIVGFAGLTGDFYPLHVDDEYARGTRFKTRIAHGPLTFALAVGLVGLTGYYGDAIIALKEIRSLRALKPVIAGDTLKVRAELVRAETGDSPKYGTIEMHYAVTNQRTETVMDFDQIMLARKMLAGSGR